MFCWLQLSVLLSIFLFVRSAYKAGSCPTPCRCLKFEGLQSVYCNGTGIESVPTGIPIDTQLLDLSYNQIDQIQKGAFKDLKDLEELDISANGLKDDGIEAGSLDLPKLVTLDLSYNKFTAIPNYLPMGIIKLWFMYNAMTTLRSDSFKEYRFLSYLDVSNNGLKNIEPETFNPLLHLQTLYIAFNNLTYSSFPPNVFAQNTNMLVLSMRFNLMEQTLNNLPMSLQHLDYVGNQIKTLRAYGFQSLPNLQTLAFWEGQVTTIEDYAFFGLSKITILDFMQDKITSPLTNNTFVGLDSLQTLYIDINNISHIETGALRPLKSISSLWLDGNQLSHLDPEVLNEKYLPHLSELYIDFNPWYCDCHLRWLREKVDNATYTIQDPHLITCMGPPNLAKKAWDELKPSDFVC